MANVNINAAEIESVRFAEQSGDVATPASGYWKLFFKAGGLYAIDDGGIVIGPIANIAKDALWDAAGDLVYGTGANTGGRLAVGTARALLRVNSDATAPEWAGVLTDWTPSITQSGDVTKTVTYAKYAYIGPLLYVCANLAITGTGTGNNDILIGNLPANAAANGAYGTAWVNDNGTAFYHGALLYIATGVFQFRAHLETNDIGSDPNFALANGDAIMFSALYPY